MKKLLALLLAVMMLVAFVGCGATNNEANVENAEVPATEAELAIACELTSEEYGIGFRKGSDLTAIVNGYIAELKEAGTLDELA